MTSDIQLNGASNCRKGCLLHNRTPHERKIGTQNITAKGTRNTTDNTLVHIEVLRYTYTQCFICRSIFLNEFNLHSNSQRLIRKSHIMHMCEIREIKKLEKGSDFKSLHFLDLILFYD